MSFLLVALYIFLLGSLGFFYGKKRVSRLSFVDLKFHSRPVYYGWWIFLLTVLPAWLFLIFWNFGMQVYLENRALKEITYHNEIELSKNSPSKDKSSSEGLTNFSESNNLDLMITKSLLQRPDLLEKNGTSYKELFNVFNKKGIIIPLEGRDYMIPIAKRWAKSQNNIKYFGSFFSAILAFIGLFFGILQIKPRQKARNKVEKIILLGLGFSSTIAVLTTIGIIFSLIFETVHFFHSVPLSNFFFGTVWDPRFAEAGSKEVAGQFGFLPLLAGTFYIAFVAMLFAIPVGLFSAIYMAEYASKRTRSIVKPLLEVLAGIPTIVYGFFALITVGPFLRDLSIALVGGQGFIMAQSVLTAGLVMGILLIPLISSLADDILIAIPYAIRQGSYGLGATQSETIKKVVLPAALPGIVGALLLAASRAIGETMIVVLAAGATAHLTLNPFESMTTITVKIVDQLTGDLEFDSPQTLVAFALGITLFLLTLLMNIYAVYIVRKYREQYE